MNVKVSLCKKLVVFMFVMLIGSIAFAAGSLSARQTGSNQMEVYFSSNYRQARIWYRRMGEKNWKITSINKGSGSLRINNVYPGTYEIKADGSGAQNWGSVFQSGMRIGGDILLTISDRPAPPPPPRRR